MTNVTQLVDRYLAVWNEGERWLPRIPVKAVDTTGAGDTLAGNTIKIRRKTTPFLA